MKTLPILFVGCATSILAQSFLVFDAPNASSTFGSGINEIGDVAGSFADSSQGGKARGFVRDRHGNFTVFDVSNALRERGWLLPAYTFPANRTDLAALRVVVKQGFTHDLADMLVADLERQLPRLEKQPAPVHDSSTASRFRH